jgi:glyoxylase-like metal-dependent hydrolase (beta-lactamase superfamily II)
MRGLLIETHLQKILIDCGAGNWWDKKRQDIYGIKYLPLPINAKDITDIVISHLHFDHAGGLVKRASDGHLQALFPQATVHLQKANWENACNPHRREQESYLIEVINCVRNYRLNLIDGSANLFPFLSVVPANGHTTGQQMVKIEEKNTTIWFAGDVIPTINHLHPAYHMGYDMCAKSGLAEKYWLLEQVANDKAWLALPHDTDLAAVRIDPVNSLSKSSSEQNKYTVVKKL